MHPTIVQTRLKVRLQLVHLAKFVRNYYISRYNSAMNNQPTHSHTVKPAIKAYLGGSFNPVHNGHIQMAMAVYNRLAPIADQQQRALQVSLLPNARSPFKQKSMDPAQRLAMLKLAVKNTPLQIDELELWQAPPVYSIDSVRTLRQRYPNDSLIFIMGMDSARSLDNWRDGLQLLDYVHLWVFDRQDDLNNANVSQLESTVYNCFTDQNITALCQELPIELQSKVTDTALELIHPIHSLHRNHSLMDNPLLKNHAQGCIYIDSQPVLAVSSTQIRQQLQTQNPASDTLIKYLNPTVYHYIIAHQLYSTAQFR